jgi:hypothetical protein
LPANIRLGFEVKNALAYYDRKKFYRTGRTESLRDIETALDIPFNHSFLLMEKRKLNLNWKFFFLNFGTARQVFFLFTVFGINSNTNIST